MAKGDFSVSQLPGSAVDRLGSVKNMYELLQYPTTQEL